MNIKEIIKDSWVQFKFYRKGELWYDVVKFEEYSKRGDDNTYYEGKVLYTFPVPIIDCGDGTFLNTDKASFFMRYIRKQLELETRSN